VDLRTGAERRVAPASSIRYEEVLPALSDGRLLFFRKAGDRRGGWRTADLRSVGTSRAGAVITADDDLPLTASLHGRRAAVLVSHVARGCDEQSGDARVLRAVTSQLGGRTDETRTNACPGAGQPLLQSVTVGDTGVVAVRSGPGGPPAVFRLRLDGLRDYRRLGAVNCPSSITTRKNVVWVMDAVDQATCDAGPGGYSILSVP
jgi:hypothetical protein